MEQYSRNRRRQFRTSAWFGPASFLLICLSVIVAMSIFFRVSVIDVEGNEDYTDQEIIDATGIDTGDNLFFMNRIGAVSRMMARLPYIQEATISRVLPNKIVITVQESNAVATVSDGTSYWMIDRDCKTMTAITESEAQGLIRVSGVTAILPSVGDPMVVEAGDEAKVDYLCEILLEIEVRGLQNRIEALDISDVTNPTFVLDDRFDVKLGAKDDTILKFGKLLSAVGKLQPGDMGTLDLSQDEKVHFLQY